MLFIHILLIISVEIWAVSAKYEKKITDCSQLIIFLLTFPNCALIHESRTKINIHGRNLQKNSVRFSTHSFTNFNFPPLCTDPMSHLSISCVLTLQALVGVKIFYNFINHHSMALIRIFIVLTWNPSDSIYFFAVVESLSYLGALGSGNVWNQ